MKKRERKERKRRKPDKAVIPFRRQLQIFKHSLNHSCSDQCICCVSSILLYLESDAGSVKSQI